jgi:undecaprenyl-diphosphatase
MRRPLSKARFALRTRDLNELLPFAVLLLSAAALLTFVALASGMRGEGTRIFDEALLRALRNPADLADPIGAAWVETMMRDITALGSTTVLTIITFGVCGFLVLDDKRAAALFVLAAGGGGALLSSALKLVFARPRPELVAHLVDEASYSFPSGHATSSAVTYLTLGALLAREQSRRRMKAYVIVAALVLTLAVGASRVYLGVHWPTDVLAGWSVGAAWAMLFWQVCAWLQRRGHIEPPERG